MSRISREKRYYCTSNCVDEKECWKLYDRPQPTPEINWANQVGPQTDCCSTQLIQGKAAPPSIAMNRHHKEGVGEGGGAQSNPLNS